ncbi:DUF1439 domain-containing protein [Alteromonadaceae bacterium M269]|nr:DUF1439 domain-containing protein [Alteromonadaceae bacterium M269]
MSQDWREKLQILFAKLMIRFKRLKHVVYTEAELNDLLRQQFPIQFPVNIPASNGEFSITGGSLRMPYDVEHFKIELKGQLKVDSMGTPLYRAHLYIHLLAIPAYNKETKVVSIDSINIKEIVLIKDEYGLINDGQSILKQLIPSPVTAMMGGTLKAMNLLSGNNMSDLTQYLKLYISGNKQRVLDYHTPEIEQRVREYASSQDLTYEMDPSEWDQALFIELGEKVAIKNGELRFIFHD